MTEAELDALVIRMTKLADDMERHATDDWDEHEDVQATANAITTLRAQLAAETARADRAESERAAQIDADAVICDELLGKIWDDEAYDCAAAIRAQPHDRTALESAIRAAKVEAWEEAAGAYFIPKFCTEEDRPKVDALHAYRAAILALIGEGV